MSKTLKPIIHHRDHERGGADVVLIAWEDCSDESTEPDPVTGGWKSVPVNVTWSVATTDSTVQAAPLGGTFHDGTVPGVWRLGSGASSVGPASSGGSWLVAFSGTISRDPAAFACVTEVWFEHDFDTAGRVALFNATLNPGDSVPLSYSAILASPLNVTLPAIIRASFAATTTLAGTMTFTWQ